MVLTESIGKSARYFYYVTIIALRLLREDVTVICCLRLTKVQHGKFYEHDYTF